MFLSVTLHHFRSDFGSCYMPRPLHPRLRSNDFSSHCCSKISGRVGQAKRAADVPRLQYCWSSCLQMVRSSILKQSTPRIRTRRSKRFSTRSPTSWKTPRKMAAQLDLQSTLTRFAFHFLRSEGLPRLSSRICSVEAQKEVLRCFPDPNRAELSKRAVSGL